MGQSLLPSSVASVNTVLMLHADTPLPVADIARAAGLAYTPTSSALATLAKRGLARRAERAGHVVFGPETQSPHYPMAYATALVDLPLASALRGERIYAVYAYGSLAHPGGGTRESDLDLFIVGDIKDREAFLQRLSAVGARLARVIDPFIVTPEDFERARVTSDEHVASALTGVRIMGTA